MESKYNGVYKVPLSESNKKTNEPEVVSVILLKTLVI